MNESLFSILLPQGGFALTLVNGYFDESGTDDQARFWLGGYLFEKKSGDAFNDKWQAILTRCSLPYWHMSESQGHDMEKKFCTRGIYKGKPYPEIAQAAIDCVNAIKDHAIRGYVFSIAKEDIELIPKISDWFVFTPYSFLCWHALLGVRHWMNEVNFDGDAAYIFEAGCEGYGALNDFMHKIFVKEPSQSLIDRFRYRSHAFDTKIKSSHLQAADMLVWHDQKYFTRNKINPRADHAELLKVETFSKHFDRSDLLKLTEKFNSHEFSQSQYPSASTV